MRQTDGAVGQAFGDEVLPSDHASALHAAVHELIDQFCQDVATLLETPERVEETSMSHYLPRCYQGRYTPPFAKRFLMATATVAWKLAQPQWHPLACMAEELALNAMVRKAEALLEEQGKNADFGMFEDSALEDLDFRVMFDPAWDGYAEETLLAFDFWFSPFRNDERVHPYSPSD
jgi:hypothetical protein